MAQKGVFQRYQRICSASTFASDYIKMTTLGGTHEGPEGGTHSTPSDPYSIVLHEVWTNSIP